MGVAAAAAPVSAGAAVVPAEGAAAATPLGGAAATLESPPEGAGSCAGCADDPGSEGACATAPLEGSGCAAGSVFVSVPFDAGFDSAAMGAGGGTSDLFTFVIANAAARPRIAITPPTTTPLGPFFFGASAAAFGADVIGMTAAPATTTAAAAAAAAGFSSSSRSPAVAGFAFSAAAFCSAVAVELMLFRLTMPESSRPASEGRAEELDGAADGSGEEVAPPPVRLCGADVDGGPGRDDAPAWLARAAISFSDPRFRSADFAGTVLGTALGGIVSVFGTLESDSWDIFFSPAEAIGA